MADGELVIHVERRDESIDEFKGFVEWHAFSNGILIEYENSTDLIPYVNARTITFINTEDGERRKLEV